MAVVPKDEDRQLKRVIAEVRVWQEISEQLVELQRYASVTPNAHLKNENWQQRAEMARRHAAEDTDPDT
jgi:hypothetical protein